MFFLSYALALVGRALGTPCREYRVADGDTLEWLAEKFGTSVGSIKRLNELDGDLIYAGSFLKIERATPFEQNLLGKKARVHERAALELGYGLESLKPVALPNPRFAVSVPILKSERQKALGPATVKVRCGDTLAGIASSHGLSAGELQRLNHLRDDIIFEGDVLAVNSGPSAADLLVQRAGQRRTYRPLFSRQVQGPPGVGGPQYPARANSAPRVQGRWKRKTEGSQPLERLVSFRAPLTAGFVSSPFGSRWNAFHEGVDIAADQGTPVLASNKGTVTFAGWNGGYGYLISILHAGGFVTRYAHCCAIYARVGQQVCRGQHVAAVGSTGNATGPHLHFEVKRNGEALDPLEWVNL